jgi:hypothetical protein
MELFREARLQNILSDIVYEHFSQEEKDRIRLLVRFDNVDLPIRDLSAFLELIDRTYGRLHPKGLASYAQQRKKHIKMHQVFFGSLEAVIEELIANIDHASYLVMLYLVLKYLPNLVEALSKSYKNLQEGNLTRLQAQEFKSTLQQDPMLASQKEQDLQLIAETMVSLIKREKKHVPRAERFSQEHVFELDLSLTNSHYEPT